MKAAAEAMTAASPRFPVKHGDDPKAWTSAIKAQLGANDALLFKASRAMKLEELARAL
jgi:UDP-N-acetylmuramyl pentapeptide synthase